jgi:hypothetical protein
MEDSEASEVRTLFDQIQMRFRTTELTVDTIHSFAEDGEIFRTHIARLNGELDHQAKAVANALLGPTPNERLKELAEVLGNVSAQVNSPESESDEEDIEAQGSEWAGREDAAQDLAVVARFLLQAIQRLAVTAFEGRIQPFRGRVGKVIEWLGDRAPSADSLRDLGARILLRRQLSILEGSARGLVHDVPSIYARFRRRYIEQGILYNRHPNGQFQPNALSPAEADVVILVMLRHARRALGRLPEANWLKPITNRYFMQVFIDEVTDFSSIQLACMIELAHPKLRSWFACGDFRQRITRHGITGPDDIQWIQTATQLGKIDVREIKIEYRQSSRLKQLAEALILGHEPPRTTEGREEEPFPLLVENAVGERLASWLIERILEVERSVGRLPSIAVFVDSEERIDPSVAAVAPGSLQHNLRIVGCRDGRDVGNADEIRVFDIQHIKGLEFEAVFFVGVDSLAHRMPDLFEKYIYVGVTRAATFLGVTCERVLPERIEPTRSLFSTGSWN